MISTRLVCFYEISLTASAPRCQDESEKGRWFEQLFMRIALQQPEFELNGIWRWPDWPEREVLTASCPKTRTNSRPASARRAAGAQVSLR